MNNNNSQALLKLLIAYAICVPVAIWMGYLLTDPLDRTNLTVVGILALFLVMPILLRWHHFLLVATWNVAMVIFFLPGGPSLWLPMVALSLGISVLYRALNNKARFISVPQITMPLICLAAVVIFTAEMTGGIGLHSLGSDVMGGKRYIFVLAAIFGFFALTAQRIPPERAKWYVTLFFLGGFSVFISDLPGLMSIPSPLYFVFLLFPPSGYIFVNSDTHATRFGGISDMAIFGFLLMLATYGVRGIFSWDKLWRPLMFVLFTILLFVGGFRFMIIECSLVFFIQFFLERLHQTKLLPTFIFVGTFMAVLCVPFASKLPYNFQRSLAFLPLKIDPMARQDAQGSADWRLQMWKAVLPQVPDHLLLGKGYAISQSEFQDMTAGFHPISAEDWGSAIAGDYHSGPLSVVLPFGIWGVIAFLWFLIASLRALNNNRRYGDPALQTVNLLLFALFITKTLMFLIIFGSLYSDMAGFIGIIGLSISLNGGIRRPLIAPAHKETETPIPAVARPQLQPFYQH